MQPVPKESKDGGVGWLLKGYYPWKRSFPVLQRGKANTDQAPGLFIEIKRV